MSTVLEKSEWRHLTRCLGPAQVLGMDPVPNRVRLRLMGSDDDVGIWARVAINGAAEIRSGDTVLVIGDDPDELYVIGLLNRKDVAVVPPTRVALSGGAYAEAVRTQGGETLRVFSGKNELIFEYDESRGSARINVEHGDLEFTAKDGSIVFASGREVLFHGQSVDVTALSRIRLGISDAAGRPTSRLALDDHRINLEGGDLRISAGQAKIHIDQASYTGGHFAAALNSAALAVHRLETTAHFIVEKAKNVYRIVEQLTQLRTGRMRTLVDTTFHFKARRAFVRSEQDYKIKAEKIHLG